MTVIENQLFIEITAFHDESDDVEIIVHWSPEACIADTAADSGLTKVMSSATQVCPGVFRVLTVIILFASGV